MTRPRNRLIPLGSVQITRGTHHSRTRLIASCCVEGYRCRYRLDVAYFACPDRSCTIP